MSTKYPSRNKPGRPRKSDVETNTLQHLKLDPQLIADHGSYLELDISTPFHPQQHMLIDKVDYERLKYMSVGQFTARATTSPTNSIIVAVNTRDKKGKFNASASFVHTLICKGNGYRWHRDSNLLNNRRNNLETDIPLQTSTVGFSSYDPTTITTEEKTHDLTNLLTGTTTPIG